MIEKIKQKYQQLEQKKAFRTYLALKLEVNEPSIEINWFTAYKIPLKYQEEILKRLTMQINFDKKTKINEKKMWDLK